MGETDTGDHRASIIAKLLAMKAKVARGSGASESEILAAIAMMAKLMRRHDIDEGELVSRGETPFGITEVEMGSGSIGPALENALWGIQAVSETQIRCITYWSSGEKSGVAIRVYGIETDRAFAEYLIALVQNASEDAWEAHRRDAGDRLSRSARKEFMAGFGASLCWRMRDIADQRDAERRAGRAAQAEGSGTAVVESMSKAAHLVLFMGKEVIRGRKRRKEIQDEGASASGIMAASDVALTRPIIE